MKFSQPVIEALRFRPWPRPDWQWPQLQSHRGYWVGGAKENTLESLSAAKKKGYQMAELDVRLSADEIPIVFHDKDLWRSSRQRARVKKLTAQQLERYDIPSLQEVLCSQNRPEKLNIEIKNDDRLDSLLERRVAEAIKDSKKSEQVLVSGFNPLSLRYFSEEMPEIPRAFLIELDQRYQLSYFRMSGNLIARAHMINWPHQLLTQNLVKALLAAKVPIATWTVNDYRRARTLLSWGVHSIISDRVVPDLL